MAGSIVIDTLQDGSGNSTSATNAIRGSAKAWVNFDGATGTRRASFNVSSVTRSATGNYTINFTNALTDGNYSVCAMAAWSNDTQAAAQISLKNTTSLMTTTSFQCVTGNSVSGALLDFSTVCCSVFR